MKTELILKLMQAESVYHSLVCEYGELVVSLTNFAISIEVSISLPCKEYDAYEIRQRYMNQLHANVGTEIIYHDKLNHDILIFKWSKVCL